MSFTGLVSCISALSVVQGFKSCSKNARSLGVCLASDAPPTNAIFDKPPGEAVSQTEPTAWNVCLGSMHTVITAVSAN